MQIPRVKGVEFAKIGRCSKSFLILGKTRTFGLMLFSVDRVHGGFTLATQFETFETKAITSRIATAWAADSLSRQKRRVSGKTSERRAHSWYDKTPDELANQLANDLCYVLSQAEAAPRLANVGANTLQKGDAFSLLMIWCSQFRGLVVGFSLVPHLSLCCSERQSMASRLLRLSCSTLHRVLPGISRRLLPAIKPACSKQMS